MSPASPMENLVAWPPPGLERLQGDLQRVTTKLLIGGLVLTLPLLAAVAIAQPFWSSGLFGDAWWILVVTLACGVGLLMDAWVALIRVLSRSARAAERGYRRRTIAMVLSDHTRDAGFILQGARAFSQMPEERRRRLLDFRMTREIVLLLAALWLSTGFAIGVPLAARGALDEAGLALWTLLPMGFAGVVATFLRTWEQVHVRRARKAWFNHPWAADLEATDISAWHAKLSGREGAIPLAVAPENRAVGLKVLAGVAMVIPFVVLGVDLPLTGMAAVGPVLTEIALPNFQMSQEKAAQAEVLRGYRLPPDTSIAANDAGEALVALRLVGQPPAVGSLRPAARTYDAPFFAEGDSSANPTGVAPPDWPQMAESVDGRLSPAAIQYLSSIGAHPALAELRTLAYASDLDEIGTAYVSPLPADLPLAALPVLRYTRVRQASQAQVGAAIAMAEQGEVDAAVLKLREVMSAGFLLIDRGTTLIANMVGFVLVKNGADALAGVLRAADRHEEAHVLEEQIAAAGRVAVRSQLDFEPEVNGIQQARSLATSSAAIPGLRWEYFVLENTIGPCANANRSLFGADDDYDIWTERARDKLVRTQAESELFELGRSGYVGISRPPSGVVERLSRLVIGNAGEGRCSAVFASLLRGI